MRNAYTLFGYSTKNGNQLSSPYYQFLPLSTNAVDAHNLFIQARSGSAGPVTHTVFTTTTSTPTTTVWIGAPAGYTGEPDSKLLVGNLEDNDEEGSKNYPVGSVADQVSNITSSCVSVMLTVDRLLDTTLLTCLYRLGHCRWSCFDRRRSLLPNLPQASQIKAFSVQDAAPCRIFRACSFPSVR